MIPHVAADLARPVDRRTGSLLCPGDGDRRGKAPREQRAHKLRRGVHVGTVYRRRDRYGLRSDIALQSHAAFVCVSVGVGVCGFGARL